jgi:ribosomal protein S18 acetylase RimI-like enzyme
MNTLPILTLLFTLLFTSIQGADVEFHWHVAREIPADDEAELKTLFIDTFLANYRSNGAYLDQSDEEIQASLFSDFDKIISPNLHSNKPQTLLLVKTENKLIGYTLFEMLDPHTVYVAELGITPAFWRKGLGKKMTFAVQEKNPHLQKIVLLTEKINLSAQRFYEALGFQPSTYTHEGYSPDRFCAYELTL